MVIVNPNIASSAHKADPYPFYARLRAEDPVYRVTLPDKQAAWLVTRYADVAATLKDERFVKDKLTALTPGQATKQPWVPGILKPGWGSTTAWVHPLRSTLYCGACHISGLASRRARSAGEKAWCSVGSQHCRWRSANRRSPEHP